MAEVPLNQDDLVTAEQLYRQALSITLENRLEIVKAVSRRIVCNL